MSDMDVQKTMEFILEQQAQIVARQAEHDARMGELMQAGLKAEKRIEGLAKIARFGMKVVLKQAENMKELRDAQKQTDEKLNALIQVVDDLVRRRPN
jgi:hypothetical protein